MNIWTQDPAPRRRLLPRLWKAGLTLAVLAVLSILFSMSQLLLAEFDRSRTLREEVHRSFERRAQLQALLSMHQDVETGQRGFLLTGDEHFLGPYHTAKRKIAESLAGVESSLGHDFPLMRDLKSLKLSSHSKLSFSEQVISLRRSGAGGAAVELVAGGSGARTMDAIRSAVAKIDAYEQYQLQQQLDRSRGATRSAERLSTTLQTLLLLLLAVAALVVSRSFRSKQAALDNVQDLNARQAAVFAAAKDGIIVLNRSGSIESLNPAAARMFGYAAEELVRRDIGLLFEVAPDRGQVETFLKRLQRRRQSDQGLVQEIWAKRSDGSTFPGDVSVSPVRLVGGVRYVAIIRDITDRKQIEQMKTEFVSTVSHELRTPLTSIAGSLGLLRGGAVGQLPGPAQRLLEVAHTNSQRLIRLINDILDVEKIESGGAQFEIKPIELQPLLQQAVEANRGFANKHNVRLVLGSGADGARVMADADRLAQVVTNLISNAAKFSPAGRAIRISVSPLDRQYRITVADRGPGIPSNFRDRIFGKFAQADSSDTRQKGGTGLGLSIVKEIVTRLGGSVSFEDRPGGGTCFHVDLPAVRADSSGHGEPPSAHEDAFRVLHVEDDPDVLRVTSGAFGGRALLEGATSLASARALLKDNAYDVVIVDIGLPDGTGPELLPELRVAGSGSPGVVVFSAEEGSSRIAAQVDAMMTKSRATLEDLVDTVLGLAGRLRQRRAG